MKIFSSLLIVVSIFLNCENLMSSEPIIRKVKETTFGIGENGKTNKFLTCRLDLFNKNSLIDEQEYYFESGALKSRGKYIYNENQLLKFIEYDTTGNMISAFIYKYEPDVKLEIKQFKNGLLETIVLIEYEAKHIAKQTTYDGDGQVIRESVYNDKNQLIKTIEYSKDVHMTWMYWYEYNKRGNMIKRNWTDETGYILSIRTFSFVLDEHQNWIRKETYEDGKLISLTLRELDYFD